MHKPRISIIAAIGRKRELGKSGSLIWRIPSDLRRLKALTMGHPLIMGRRTFESIGKPLQGRTNIVVSRHMPQREGVVIVDSLECALEVAQGSGTDEIFVFGGAQVYEAALPHVDRLYLTCIDKEDPGADAFFPAYDEFTKEVEREEHLNETPPHIYVTLER